MTYIVSLKITAIIIGIVAILGHLPAALAPQWFSPVLKSLPRNYPLGIVFMLAATLWFTILTGMMDLGELSNMRTTLMAVWSISGILVIIFVPGFLAARGLGCLLLLASALVLDATFLSQTPSSYVLKILAYVWVIWGMCLVYSPHLWRDSIEFATRTPQRLRWLAWPGVAFGVLLVALGLFVYQN